MLYNFTLPQVFHVGHFAVHYYGLTMAAAVMAGFWLALKREKQFSLPQGTIDQVFLYLVVGGFAGARLYHVFSSLSFYLYHPLNILFVWQGGLSIFGAIFGGFAGLIIFLHKNRSPLSTLHSPLFTLLDWLTPSLLLGQIIGRFGNLFNYEALGGPTGLPWGLFVPEDFRPVGFENFAYFHPFPIYEQVLNLFLLLTLYFLEKKVFRGVLRGGVFGSYLLGYGFIRFFLEWQRLDHNIVFGFVPFNTLTSLFLAVLGLSVLIIIYNRKKNF